MNNIIRIEFFINRLTIDNPNVKKKILESLN